MLSSVREWLAHSARTYNRARIVIDPYQAIGLAQELRRAGTTVREFTFSSASTGRLASTLHLLLRNRTLRLPDDPGLLDELARVRLRETSPGVLRLDHDPNEHDDQAIAIALAATELLEQSSAGRPRIRSLRGTTHPRRRFGQAPQRL